MDKVRVKLYTRKTCPLCVKGKEILMNLKSDFDFVFEEVDIYTDDRLTEEYGLMIPVVEIDGEEVQFGQIDRQTISHFLRKKINLA